MHTRYAHPLMGAVDSGGSSDSSKGVEAARQDSSSGGEDSPQGGLLGQFCSKGKAKDMALRTAATAALGPAGALMPVPTLSSNPTPAERAYHDAVVAHNDKVIADNLAREQAINEFVEQNRQPGEAGATDGDRSVGDAVASVFQTLSLKYGSDFFKGKTLLTLMATNPGVANEAFALLQEKFPILRGKTLDQVIDLIPDIYKNRDIQEIVDLLPKGAKTGSIIAPTSGASSKLLIYAGLGLVGIFALAAATRKKSV